MFACTFFLKLHLLLLQKFFTAATVWFADGCKIWGKSKDGAATDCQWMLFAVIWCSDLGRLQPISGVLWSKCLVNGSHFASPGDLFIPRGNKNVAVAKSQFGE